MKNNKNLTIGIDLGGTKMAAVLFSGEKVLARSVLATPKDSVDHIVVMIQALLDPLFDFAKEKKSKISALGLGIAALPDEKMEKIQNSTNLPILNNVRLPEILAGKFGLPVRIDNDANCFVRAEKLSGAAKKFDNVYGLTIGTGIGGGWWTNGGIYLGTAAAGNEPGEMIVDVSAMLDLEEIYHRLTQFNPGQMAEEAWRGDMLAQKTYDELGRIFGAALATIANLIAPEVFVIGGGVVESSELFMGTMKKTMLEHIESPDLKKRIKILKSKLGQDACAIGAALLFEEKSKA